MGWVRYFFGLFEEVPIILVVSVPRKGRASILLLLCVLLYLLVRPSWLLYGGTLATLQLHATSL